MEKNDLIERIDTVLHIIAKYKEGVMINEIADEVEAKGMDSLSIRF